MTNVEYKIPEHKRLIIVDAHDTVLKRDLTRDPTHVFGDPRQSDQIVWVLRDGLLNFLDYYAGLKGIAIVISSDGNADRLRQVFEKFGVGGRIRAVYGREHLHKETYLKQLDRILADLNVSAAEAVLIGDASIDRHSAERYGVDFIRVPSTLEDENFSFNRFLRLDFVHGADGLELNRILNPGPVHYNLPSPELVEAAVVRGEGKLAHLGPLVYDTGEPRDYVSSDAYITVEPSSEARLHWEGAFERFPADRFQMLYLRMTAFLQDRELFIQDCCAGADRVRRFPLRIITQTAVHALFARNTFVQLLPEDQADFFPEFTVIHAPHFHAIPELDKTKGSSFVVLHMARKLALIGGTAFCGEIRRAVFGLIAYHFVEKDVLPMRCTVVHARRDGPALFFGRSGPVKTAVAEDPRLLFLGEAHHCWTPEGIFNLEWGCYTPVRGLDASRTPELHASVRRFHTILENTCITPTRRLDFADPTTHQNARASYPISHRPHGDRSGTAGPPTHAFVLLGDPSLDLPALAAASAEAFALVLLGDLDPESAEGDRTKRERSPLPCFGACPAHFHPAVYALLLWEKLKAAGCSCWVVNYAGFEGDRASAARDACVEVIMGRIAGTRTPDPLSGFQIVRPASGSPGRGGSYLAALAWALRPHLQLLEPEMVRALPFMSET